MQFEKNLEQAGKIYGECAKAVNLKLKTKNHPNANESELLIAFGIASDWVRRAAALEPLTYNRRLMNRSNRSPSIAKIVKFTMAWSSMNALFSRDSVRHLLSTKKLSSELERFRLFYDHSSLNPTQINNHLKSLHTLLNCNIITRTPSQALGTPVTTLHALYYKYTPSDAQSRGASKIILSSLNSGNLSSLDLPIIIYLARNWCTHGAIIDSSFRSTARFEKFMNTILISLSEIHLGSAKCLLTKL